MGGGRITDDAWSHMRDQAGLSAGHGKLIMHDDVPWALVFELAPSHFASLWRQVRGQRLQRLHMVSSSY